MANQTKQITGLPWLDNLINGVENNPQVQQVVNSPSSKIIQTGIGNPSAAKQIVPSFQNLISDIQTGKYNPQLVYGGEMAEVAPFEAAGAGSPFGRILPQQNPVENPNFPYDNQPNTSVPNQQVSANTNQSQPPLEPPAPEKTYSVPDNIPKSEILENQKRNIQIDGRDIKTPNKVNQINATLNGYGIK